MFRILHLLQRTEKCQPPGRWRVALSGAALVSPCPVRSEDPDGLTHESSVHFFAEPGTLLTFLKLTKQELFPCKHTHAVSGRHPLDLQIQH